MPGKRTDVISWDEFFMKAAVAASLRSKDPNTQVGACIADTNHRILSVGYNGTPSGLNDDEFPWGTNDDPLYDKHNYVIHAEANAILNYRGSLKDMAGATVYVTLFPCHECAKTLVQAGIGEVVYLDDKYCGTQDNLISKRHPRPLRRLLPPDLSLRVARLRAERRVAPAEGPRGAPATDAPAALRPGSGPPRGLCGVAADAAPSE